MVQGCPPARSPEATKNQNKLSACQMKNKQLNKLVTMTANIGILIGLVLVIIELRQNDDNLEAFIELSLSNSYEELATIGIENPQFTEALMKAIVTPDQLSVPDQMQIMAWQYRYLLVLWSTYRLNEEGLLTDSMWQEKAGHFTVMLKQEKLYDLYLESRRHNEFFSAAFYTEIEEVLAAQLHAADTEQAVN